MPNTSITKPNTAETFAKEVATLRVSVDAVKTLIRHLDALTSSVILAAEANAKQNGRTTIMPVDVDTAMNAVTGSSPDLPDIFRRLEKLDAKNTAALAGLIKTWIDTH